MGLLWITKDRLHLLGSTQQNYTIQSHSCSSRSCWQWSFQCSPHACTVHKEHGEPPCMGSFINHSVSPLDCVRRAYSNSRSCSCSGLMNLRLPGFSSSKRSFKGVCGGYLFKIKSISSPLISLRSRRTWNESQRSPQVITPLKTSKDIQEIQSYALEG